MKLSPYGVDLGKIIRLAIRPNIAFGPVESGDDSVFPEDGLLRIPDAVPAHLCDQAIRDYDDFEVFRESRGCAVRGANGRNYRLVNFHLESKSLLAAGLCDSFHKVATAFFRRQSTIYTSLSYKHGSQQKAHVDTPYFWTRPFNLFVGVWLALEDVAPDAGPLFYYPGSHRLFLREDQLIDVYCRANGDLQGMFDLIREEVEKTTRPEPVLIRKGDAVVWHPGIVHGGMVATDPKATRFSIVYHFAPLGVNVRNNAFPRDFRNFPTYGVVQKGGNYYCRVSLPATML